MSHAQIRAAASAGKTVAVYGAYGHTAGFVIDELLRRGLVPRLCGRDAAKLAELADAYPHLQRGQASIEDPQALDRMLQGAVAVLNCAGPFLDTAAPVLEAALRAGLPYLDLCAEQGAVLDLVADYDEQARAAGIVAIPAMAFFGGLADLLTTAALDGASDADAVEIAVALDSWHPTLGTRVTGQRNQRPRLVIADGRLAPLAQPPATREWTFPPPFGAQATLALPFSEIATLSRHLRCAQVDSYMNLTAVQDVRDPGTPTPTAVDESGRSAQRYVVDVQVRRDGRSRRATAQGQDIYAVSAPLIVEALVRILDGRAIAVGVVAPGQAFDAADFLTSLTTLEWTLDQHP
ncbi:MULTISPECIES: saccharopine dehydrogenase NADP-binding domain-containing protein [unclassified Lysobacter]|uniref:saccharopine dehydrogenase family protein n=1 Tax=unclassified Lysobacter TaxID=2635362 RepID=UPI0006F22E1C|nr:MULTISPECIES: saccharopine dehydrogenase NADP-binding domain-containing protein [unclassified Lysobacter]KQZ56500.1 saccharopine dehydrogenase [Lysobacter sp. Root559]KRC35056.1 saccharopine dehydrogenase [Lysobacter sp. Root76]KRD70745.1 saccharopine dehydrogenase [Lysobacter sp. Root96]